MEGALALALLSVLLLGLYHRSVTRVVAEVYAPLRDGLGSTATALGSARGRISQSLRAKLEAVGLTREAWSPAHIAGAILNTLLFAVYIVCDYVTLMMTLEALGLTDRHKIPFEEHLGILLGLAVIIPAVHSVWIIMEMLDRTDLVPARRLSGTTRGIFATLSAIMLALALTILVSGGLFRGSAVSDSDVAAPSTSPSLYATPTSAAGASAALETLQAQERELPEDAISAWERRSKMVLMVGMPVMLLLGSIVAFAFGPAYLLLLLPFGFWIGAIVATAIAQASVLGLRWLLLIVLGVLLMILAGLSRIGITISRPFVNGCRALHRRAESERRGRPSIWLSLLSALTAWALDVETPEDGIGARDTIDPPTQVQGGAPSPPLGETRVQDARHRPERSSVNPELDVAAAATPVRATAPVGPADGRHRKEDDVVDLQGEILPHNGWNPFPPRAKTDEVFELDPAGAR